MLAIVHHNIPVIDELLEYSDVDLLATDNSGRTPIDIATELGFLDIVKMIEEVVDGDGPGSDDDSGFDESERPS